ncbi:hypothetical protein [Leptospira ilyithenensis]|uniref:Lipoprotein n=1 Tax=Leptospira ilyithenensis TaxID=2484901 RepID=A0A4R9LL13_9LEPT|nr:hypothetical protein [Leptospira ilyithenensis]TGN08306.1 hypothetical protein EHS11_15450 [Leptospira ilyithenensis]
MKRFVFLSFLVSFFAGCNPELSKENSITSQLLCDNFDSKVLCTEPKEKIGTVLIPRTGTKREEKSWEDFSNYLYFKVRETPGFLLTFQRNFTPEESSSIRKEYAAYIGLNGVRERMEGFELGENTIASFHYLGALLKEEKRHTGEAKKKVNLEKGLSLVLEFEYQLPKDKKGQLIREIDLRWKP